MLGLEEYNGAVQGYLDGYYSVDRIGEGGWSEGSRAILEGQAQSLPGFLPGALRSGSLLLCVALLCGLAQTAERTLGLGGVSAERLAGAAAVCAVTMADVNVLMGLGRETLERMEEFSALLLPTVTAACALAGQSAAAVARQSATLLFLKLLLTMADKLILPLVCGYVMTCAAHAALGNEGLKRVAKFLKWAATVALTLLFTGFVLSLGITGAVAANGDLAAQKAAKTALSRMVPVVGGILADAAETVAAGAGVLKGTVGVAGLLAVLAICAGPFLRLGVHYLTYKLTGTLAATAAPGPVADLIDELSGGFALLLGMVGGGGVILYVALVTSIGAVSG